MTKKEILNANIINLLGIEALPQDRQVSILDQVSDLVQRRIVLRVMDSLKDEQKEKMAALENDYEALAEYLAKNIPGLEKITQEEIIKVKTELLDVLPKE
ncbi:MAG: hypothetical protein ACOZBH_01875 [Patescibacteria group bacterium]